MSNLTGGGLDKIDNIEKTLTRNFEELNSKVEEKVKDQKEKIKKIDHE